MKIKSKYHTLLKCLVYRGFLEFILNDSSMSYKTCVFYMWCVLETVIEEKESATEHRKFVLPFKERKGKWYSVFTSQAL